MNVDKIKAELAKYDHSNLDPAGRGYVQGLQFFLDVYNEYLQEVARDIAHREKIADEIERQRESGHQ